MENCIGIVQNPKYILNIYTKKKYFQIFTCVSVSTVYVLLIKNPETILKKFSVSNSVKNSVKQ